MGFRFGRWIANGLAVLAVASVSTTAQSVGERAHTRASGTTIAVLPPGTIDRIVVNPDHRRVAYVARDDGAEFVVFDRRNGRRYSRVGSLTFSPDGRRLAYTAGKDDRALVVIDGVEGKLYDRIDSGPLFSPDGQRFAYVASSGSQSFLVVDGLEGPPSDSSPIDDHGLAFSADGERVARKVTANGKQFVMLNDGSHRQYDVIRGRSISFVPHLNRLAYVAGEGGEEFIVEEGRSWKRHPAIVHGPVFTSNGTRLAYIARDSSVGKDFVVVDGIEAKHYDEIISGPVFSPDGKRYAYTARIGQSRVVVIDGREQAKHWSIPYGPLFSPDSQRIAWTVQTTSEGRLEHYVVIDGAERTRYRDISMPAFSPDSRRMAYAARTGNKWFMVIDEHEGKKFAAVGGRLFENPLSGPVFTGDSRHVAYAAGRSSGSFNTVIVDGVEGRPAGEILQGHHGWFFLSEFQLRYLSRDGNRVVLNDEFVSK